MNFTGTVENGVVKLPVDAALPNGTKVHIELVAQPQGKASAQWQFPEGRHLGQFGLSAQDWRMLANEDAA